MALHFGDINKASDGEAEELSVKGSSDGFTNGCLAHTGRSDKAEDLALHGPSQLANSQKFEYAFLHGNKSE